MTTYNNTDRVQHQYLTSKFLEDIVNTDKTNVRINLISKTYENVDREIGRILDRIHKDTLVILISDHGSGPIRRVFFLNRWLQEHGFLSYRQKSHVGFHIVENARHLSKRLLPRWAKGFIKGFFPQVRDKVESYRYFSEMDWTKTIAYGFGTYGNLYINLKGREPHGIVPIEDFDKICNQITEKLLDLRDPDTGTMLIERVYRKENLYHGLCSTQAPDLIIGWKDYEYYTSTDPVRERGSYFGKFLKIDSSGFDHVGTHRLNGIFIAHGKNVKQGNVLYGAHIADISPTILFALGQPIPNEMDGKVLFDIFTGDFLKGCSPKYVSLGEKTLIGSSHVDYTAEESKEVKERLKGLGYL